ncbi:MAG TPA: hypothetical protein VMZ31_08465 [Phycisphaerae bacterium]|nr:hypothetical protein [Phycisphaerae bacterium]
MTTGVTVNGLGGLLVGLCVLAIIMVVVLGLLLKWRPFRWAVGVVLLIMLLLAVLLLFLSREAVYVPSHHRSARVLSPVPEEPVLPLVLPMAQATTSWSEAMDRTFAEADVHPSARAAARALAWRLAERFGEVFSKTCEPKQIRVVDDAAATELLDAFIDALRQQELGPLIVRCSDSDFGNLYGNCDAAVRIDQATPSTQGTTDAPESGRLEVAAWVSGPRIASDRARFRVTATFADKRWVDDFAAFASDEPDREWLVAYSPKVADSRHDAHQQVLHTAAAKLRPYLRDYLRGQPSRRAQGFAEYPDDVLDAQIETVLRSGELIADRFVQRVRRPYGDVWREALLIPASADWIASMGVEASNRLGTRRDYIVAQAGSKRAEWIRMVLSIAGLIALICVMYLFLNFATKGYYVWALRGAAVVIAVAAVLFALTFW